MEPNKRPGWYYAGNGQLRFMDADGWTDQYRDIDDPAPPVNPSRSEAQLLPATPTMTTPTPNRVKPWVVGAAAAAVTAVAVSTAWGTGLVGAVGVAQPTTIAAPAAAVKQSPTAAPSSTSRSKAPPSPKKVAATPPPKQAPAPTKKAEAPTTKAPAPTEEALAPPPPVESDFDQKWALAKVADIIEDIGRVDERFGDGIQVDGALILLSDNYGRLADAGVPPGLDRADYLARVTTLQSFAGQAADAYDLDPTDATAKYLVVREETGVLFKQINGAIGSDLALP